MELLLVIVLLLVLRFFQAREQGRRIVLLGSHLARYDIEKLMETLADGYLRALGETDASRQAQVWEHLQTSEQRLADQVQRLAKDMALVDAGLCRTSRWSLPFAAQLFPWTTFDVRAVLQVHAQGIADVLSNAAGLPKKQQAFTLCAEMFLLQHSCHWFCRSFATASARLVFRHHTALAQVLQSVSASTRRDYTALTKLASP